MSGPRAGAIELPQHIQPVGGGEAALLADTSWRSQAFGLDLRGDFEAPGLARGPAASPGGPIVRVTAVSSDPDAAIGWPIEESHRLLHWRLEHGPDVMTVDHHPERGYRLYALRQGTYFVAADGESICCVPPAIESWIWQRFLVGQVLPLAAVLNGYEVLHASAVAVADRAVAFAASSGEGKTSLAVNLVLRGARFLTDDVTAVSLRNGQPMVHPGPGLTNLRWAEDACIGSRRALLGEVIGSDQEALRLALPRDPRPVPLAALYFLERVSEGTTPRFETVDDVNFGSLLGCGYTRFVSTRERMRMQLVIYAAIAAGVRVVRVSIPAAVSADLLSAYVESHLLDDV
jgi:hypothetical protein